jgi:hypothetical protein
VSEAARIVDIGDPGSWPDAVVNIVASTVERSPEPNWREYPFDNLGWSDFEMEERQLRHELHEHRIIGYHATRLLTHEISNIRQHAGLQILTETLRQQKIIDAIGQYPEAFAEDPDGSLLLKSGPNDWQGSADVRLGSIDFVAPFILFDHDARGLMNIFDTWGGETLGWLRKGRGSSFASRRLTEASEPAIIELAAKVATVNTYTPFLPAFAGALEAVPGSYWHQWRTTESIPPEFILDILTIRSDRWPAALDEYRT